MPRPGAQKCCRSRQIAEVPGGGARPSLTNVSYICGRVAHAARRHHRSLPYRKRLAVVRFTTSTDIVLLRLRPLEEPENR
jgi:hypothetical protein